MVEEFKKKADRPHASDNDVVRLLLSFGGDIDKAAEMIKRK